MFTYFSTFRNKVKPTLFKDYFIMDRKLFWPLDIVGTCTKIRFVLQIVLFPQFLTDFDHPDTNRKVFLSSCYFSREKNIFRYATVHFHQMCPPRQHLAQQFTGSSPQHNGWRPNCHTSSETSQHELFHGPKEKPDFSFIYRVHQKKIVKKIGF